MTIRDRLAALAAALPSDGSVVLTAATLREWLDEEQASPGRTGPVAVDLTVSDVASMLGRKESTIRGWLGQKRIPEAYRFNGVEWRIPPTALERFLEEQRTSAAAGQRSTRARALGSGRTADLGAWRKVRKAGGFR
jgi:excisionase family DNA binding protein